MAELFQTLLLLLGLLAARVADPGDPCPSGACPAVPERPMVSWGAPQTLRADQVRLFSRGERRPGQADSADESVWVLHAAPELDGERAFLLVAPAPERLRSAIAPHAAVEVRLRRVPAPR